MDKYIKIDTAKKTLLDYIHEFDAYRANPDFVRGITYAREVLDRVSLEDVAQVRHGRWGMGRFNLETGNYEEQCTRCRNFSKEYDKPYCPNCGSKMDGGKNDAID